jgi:hypothetical protein
LGRQNNSASYRIHRRFDEWGERAGSVAVAIRTAKGDDAAWKVRTVLAAWSDRYFGSRFVYSDGSAGPKDRGSLKH